MKCPDIDLVPLSDNRGCSPSDDSRERTKIEQIITRQRPSDPLNLPAAQHDTLAEVSKICALCNEAAIHYAPDTDAATGLNMG